MTPEVNCTLEKYWRFKEELRTNPPEFSRAVRSWLESDVSPIISELQTDYRFQDSVLWPFENLLAGTTSDVRQTIDEFDGRIVELSDLLNRLDWNVPQLEVPESVNCLRYSAELRPTRLSESELVARVAAASERPWFDFANAADFRTPYGSGLFLTNPSEHPDLRVVPQLSWGTPLFGDLVSRCLLYRMAFWNKAVTMLHALLNRVEDQIDFDRRTQLFNLNLAVNRAFNDTFTQCNRRLENHHEAAIIMAQILMGFGREGEISWLDADRNDLDVQRQTLPQYFLEPCVDLNTTDQIAQAFRRCTSFLNMPPDPEELLLRNAERYRLVIDLSTSCFFWNGQRFDDLSASSWEFFSTLVELRKNQNRPMDFMDLNSQGSYKTFKVQKRRLIEALSERAPDLAEMIESAGRCYKFKLNRSEIELFNRSENGRVNTIEPSPDAILC